MKPGKSKYRRTPKRVLRFPDPDHTKLAVLNTLDSLKSQRSYSFAIDDFISLYCSEPRIVFKQNWLSHSPGSEYLAPATINLRLAAARAGERVHLSQSAMSRALERLRETLGDDLLIRSEGRYLLTARRITLLQWMACCRTL
jgi:Bacterial regulatory helix-turn-helix protein, lysR family